MPLCAIVLIVENSWFHTPFDYSASACDFGISYVGTCDSGNIAHLKRVLVKKTNLKILF